MATQQRACAGFGDQGPHEVPWTEEYLGPWAMDPNRKTVRCRSCDRESRRARKSNQQTPATVDLTQLQFEDEKKVVTLDSGEHEYVPDPELMALWQAAVRGTLKHGDPPMNLIFYGPSGSGKTEGAKFLADSVSLPFTKVDAASMTDPESWFGNREIVLSDGQPVTRYVASAFVEAIQKAGVVFIDEMNRVDDQHRNITLPLTDGTGVVTNPLTGELVARHPHCFIIMAGNRGLQFTGTSAVDPAFTSRSMVVLFDYIDRATEERVVMQATGCDEDTAYVFTRFAEESRAKAKADPDFNPISTREVIMACRQVARGLDRDLAAKFAMLNAQSEEGGDTSVRHELEDIWAGVRVTQKEIDADGNIVEPGQRWVCPEHGQSKPSDTQGYLVCGEIYCDHTSIEQLTCSNCGILNDPGRVTFCVGCGSTLS